MSDENKRRELIDSAYNLLNDLIISAEFLWENSTKSIIYNEREIEFSIVDFNLGFKRKYSLSEVSYILKDNVDGLWAGEKSFFGYIKFLENKLEEKLEECLEKGKGEYLFLDYCKKLYNLKVKAHLTYYKLREIEKLA